MEEKALTKQPTLALLIRRHRLTAIALAAAALVDPGMIDSVCSGMKTHAVNAQGIVNGINKLVHTAYTLDDINPTCYFGSMEPVDPFTHNQEGIQR